jgi:hypothetical protein
MLREGLDGRPNISAAERSGERCNLRQKAL